MPPDVDPGSAAAQWAALSEALLAGLVHMLNNRVTALSVCAELATMGDEQMLSSGVLTTEVRRMQAASALIGLLPSRPHPPRGAGAASRARQRAGDARASSAHAPRGVPRRRAGRDAARARAALGAAAPDARAGGRGQGRGGRLAPRRRASGSGAPSAKSGFASSRRRTEGPTVRRWRDVWWDARRATVTSWCSPCHRWGRCDSASASPQPLIRRRPASA